MRPLRGLLPIFALYQFIGLARADFILHSWEDHSAKKSTLKLQLSETYYLTTSNYDAVGSSLTPLGFQSYSRFQTELSADYGLLERLTLFGRGTWAYLSINSVQRPGVGYSFADQTIGATYRILETARDIHHATYPIASYFVDIQGQMDFPGYNTTTSETNQTPYPGDGTFDFTGGLFAGMPIFLFEKSAIQAVAGAGYTYRTTNFSNAIPWSAGFQYSSYQEGFFATAVATGVTSLKTDPNALSTIRPNAGAGGSFYIGGTNPSLVTLRGSIGYQFDGNITLALHGSQTVWGQAAPQGFSAMAAFQFLWDGGTKNPIRTHPNSYTHSNRGFINYSMDARVLKSNDRLNLVKIDKGSQDGVEVGQFFDIFVAGKEGREEAIARGKVTSVRAEEAAIEVMEFFKEILIEEGFVAKKVVQ